MLFSLQEWDIIIICLLIIDSNSRFVFASNIISIFHIVNDEISVHEHATKEPGCKGVNCLTWVNNENWEIADVSFLTPLCFSINQIVFQWNLDLSVVCYVCSNWKVHFSTHLSHLTTSLVEEAAVFVTCNITINLLQDWHKEHIIFNLIDIHIINLWIKDSSCIKLSKWENSNIRCFEEWILNRWFEVVPSWSL